MSTKSETKRMIDWVVYVMAGLYGAMRLIVVPYCVIKSNASPAIKLLAAACCWHGSSETSSVLEKARKVTYKMYSVDE